MTCCKPKPIQNPTILLQTSLDNFRHARTLRIWYMYYEQGYTQEEIAGFEGISQQSISKHIRRAVWKIRQANELDKEGEVRLKITLKKNGHVSDVVDITLRDAIRSIVLRDHKLRIE